MSSLIKGTHHVSLKAPDMATYEKALDFYGNVLGLKVIRTWDTDSSPYIMFDTGNNIIELSADGSSIVDGPVHHFALATDHVEEVIEVIRKAGYEIHVEPRDIVIASEPPLPVTMAFCIGPCKEKIEFFRENY